VRRARRLLRVALHLAVLCAASFVRPPPRARRAWARRLLAILSVRLESEVVAVAPGSLVVANHVSWLDAVVLHALFDATFVAKAEARRWPLLGWALARNGTLFIERRPCRALLRLNEAVALRLARGESVAAFPEGTSTTGAGVLAFKPALFQPAVRGGRPVHAIALAYRNSDGSPCAAAAFVGDMTLWQSLRAITALPALSAQVRDGGRIDTAGLHRKQAARLAHAAVQSRVCGSGALAGRQETSGCAGSGSPESRSPSSIGPTWASNAEVSRT
jgi:1-acyl-sn-glycerol-3-phosphate acyltransferase